MRQVYISTVCQISNYVELLGGSPEKKLIKAELNVTTQPA